MFEGNNTWLKYGQWMEKLYANNHEERLTNFPSMSELSELQFYQLDQQRNEVIRGYHYRTATEDSFEMHILHGWAAHGWFAVGNRRYYIMIKRLKK